MAGNNTCDWQVSCKEIRERGKHLLQSEQWTDCSFLVGSEPNQTVVKGHKLILAMASPVFEAMFFGKMAETTEPIPIVDVRAEAFKALLEYIYTDSININSFDKACEMCYSAKKYMLPHLVEECTKFMWSDLSPKNACRAFEFAKLFEEPNLMDRCLQIICHQTMDVLSETSFNDVDISTLITIFDQPYLNVQSELILFEAAEKYVKAQVINPRNSQMIEPTPPPTCASQKATETPESTECESSTCQNKNGATDTSQEENETMETFTPAPSTLPSVSSPKPSIRNAVQKIRFLTLTPQQFAEGPSTSNLLTQSEAFAILMNISSPSCGKTMPEGFSTLKQHRKNSFIHCLPVSVSPLPSSSHATREPGDQINMSEYMSPTTPPYMQYNMRDKYYCDRAVIVHQTDRYNTNILDCSLTFSVDKSICIIGIKVPTQANLEDMHHTVPKSDSYPELLYAHLLDSDGSRLTYTHCTPRVLYRSLLEITFNRPVYIQKNKIYKICVVFNKAGWYPIDICSQTVVSDSIVFNFGVGADSDSVRDGLIRSLIFTY